MSEKFPEPTKEDFKRGAADIAAMDKIRRATPSKSDVRSLPGVTVVDNPDGTWKATVSGKGKQAAAEMFRRQHSLMTDRGYEVAAREGREAHLKTRWRGKPRMRIDRYGHLWRRDGDSWVEVKD